MKEETQESHEGGDSRKSSRRRLKKVHLAFDLPF